MRHDVTCRKDTSLPFIVYEVGQILFGQILLVNAQDGIVVLFHLVGIIDGQKWEDFFGFFGEAAFRGAEHAYEP